MSVTRKRRYRPAQTVARERLALCSNDIDFRPICSPAIAPASVRKHLVALLNPLNTLRLALQEIEMGSPLGEAFAAFKLGISKGTDIGRKLGGETIFGLIQPQTKEPMPALRDGRGAQCRPPYGNDYPSRRWARQLVDEGAAPGPCAGPWDCQLPRSVVGMQWESPL
jgi:hypothetical protein